MRRLLTEYRQVSQPNIEGAQVGQGLRPRSEDDDLPEDDEDDDGEDE